MENIKWFLCLHSPKELMKLNTKHREILIYSISMAVLLLTVKWLEAHFIVFNYRLDFFIGAIAILFTVLGIWLALKLAKPKIKTQIIEKEVYVENPSTLEIDQQEIEKLGISSRELDVLDLMAKGLTNEEIGDQLYISLNTVKTHTSNIFIKLDVKRRTQAVEKAKRLNIIH